MSEAQRVAVLAEQLVTDTDDGVIIAGNDGTILAWSDGAARIFGWTRDQAVGENIDMLIPDNQKDAHWTGYDHVLESGETKFKDGALLNVSGLKADGSRVGVAMSITPLKEGGTTTAIGVIVRTVRPARA